MSSRNMRLLPRATLHSDSEQYQMISSSHRSLHICCHLLVHSFKSWNHWLLLPCVWTDATALNEQAIELFVNSHLHDKGLTRNFTLTLISRNCSVFWSKFCWILCLFINMKTSELEDFIFGLKGCSQEQSRARHSSYFPSHYFLQCLNMSSTSSPSRDCRMRWRLAKSNVAGQVCFRRGAAEGFNLFLYTFDV